MCEMFCLAEGTFRLRRIYPAGNQSPRLRHQFSLCNKSIKDAVEQKRSDRKLSWPRLKLNASFSLNSQAILLRWIDRIEKAGFNFSLGDSRRRGEHYCLLKQDYSLLAYSFISECSDFILILAGHETCFDSNFQKIKC